jgi:hypothetical protein
MNNSVNIRQGVNLAWEIVQAIDTLTALRQHQILIECLYNLSARLEKPSVEDVSYLLGLYLEIGPNEQLTEAIARLDSVVEVMRASPAQ